MVTIYPRVDRQTRTLQVELKLANEKYLLKPGMFASISFILAHKDNVAVVLKDTVLGREEGRRYVFIVNGTKAGRVHVKIGIEQGPLAEVIEGLKPGDILVTSGMNYLRDGYEVEVIKEESKR